MKLLFQYESEISFYAKVYRFKCRRTLVFFLNKKRVRKSAFFSAPVLQERVRLCIKVRELMLQRQWIVDRGLCRDLFIFLLAAGDVMERLIAWPQLGFGFA